MVLYKRLKTKTMTSKITFLFLCLGLYSFSQINNFEGGEFIFNAAETPCLTFEQRTLIKTQLNESISILNAQNQLAFDDTNRGANPQFIWPVQKATGTVYNDVWSISNYVDHNAAYPNQLTDYDCGTKTYDTNNGYNHQGVDIFTWPFGWKMMDNDEAEIIAAAPGQIIAKGDGEYDRSCGFNNNPWNAVYVQHSDGSIAWYGHMKNGSLTSKNVGEMVAEGEYLGIVGSSGNSTGPHLHFEVYTDNTYTQLVDPYAGTCNTLNATTWWQSQKPYSNPRINAVLTHSAAPVFPACPNQEVTNESNTFDVSATIYFALYLRDQASGTAVNLKIIKPDNSILYNWNFNLTDNYVASYWYWYYSGIYDMNGEWKWEATYNGETVTHSFNISGALSVKDNTYDLGSIYPNPFNDVINVTSNTIIDKVTINDVLGKTIKTINNSEGIKTIRLNELSNGMYFLTLENQNQNRQKTIKIIKE